MNAEVQDLPTDLPAVNTAALRCYLNFMVSELNILRARTLDDAEFILRKLCASQNLFLFRGGNHLAVHMFSGHSARMLFVTEA